MFVLKAYTTVHLEGENINKNTPFMVEEIAKTLKANNGHNYKLRQLLSDLPFLFVQATL